MGNSSGHCAATQARNHGTKDNSYCMWVLSDLRERLLCASLGMRLLIFATYAYDVMHFCYINTLFLEGKIGFYIFNNVPSICTFPNQPRKEHSVSQYFNKKI